MYVLCTVPLLLLCTVLLHLAAGGNRKRTCAGDGQRTVLASGDMRKICQSKHRGCPCSCSPTQTVSTYLLMSHDLSQDTLPYEQKLPAAWSAVRKELESSGGQEFVEELFKDIMMDNTQPLTLPESINETTKESSSPRIKEETVLCDEVILTDSNFLPADLISVTQYQSSFINDESAPCEIGILTSPDIVAPTDQTRLRSYSHITEEPFSSDGKNLKDPNFYTSTDHGQYLASHIKEETSVQDERHFTDLATFTAPDHLQQYLSNHIQKDPVSYDGERISNIYSAPDNTAVCTNDQNLENHSNSKINEIEVIYQHPVQSTFGDISNLTKYQRAHSRKKTPQCPECGEYFLRKVQLVSHQRLHMGQNPLQCPECGRTFSRTSQLINHQKNHKGKQLFKCSECGKFWPDKAQLVLHQQSHADEKQSMFLDCGKNMPCHSHLAVHQRTHTGGRPFSFSECGTHVTVKEHLIHLRSHQGEKLDECIQCEKHSKHKVSLTNHKLIHNPMK